MPGRNFVRRHSPGGLLALVQTEGAHHGLHHYPSGTDLARAEDPGGHRAQRLGVTWGLEAAGLGAASAVGGPAPSTRRQWLARLTAGGSLGSPPGGLRARAQLEDNSGSPGSLRGVLSGLHPLLPFPNCHSSKAILELYVCMHSVCGCAHPSRRWMLLCLCV